MQTGSMKVIHHWLPQEVGELMLYYLWLVLPFWEKVQISVDADFKGSPFVWGRPALEVKREGEERAKQPVQAEEAEQPVQLEMETIDNEVYKSASIWKREWTSARMRGII
jgi:hypothetical protein